MRELLALASHPVFQALALWYVTMRQPQLRRAERRVAVAGLVLLFITRLRWNATIARLRRFQYDLHGAFGWDV